jgi:hypothetical protein
MLSSVDSFKEKISKRRIEREKQCSEIDESNFFVIVIIFSK